MGVEAGWIFCDIVLDSVLQSFEQAKRDERVREITVLPFKAIFFLET